MLGGSNALKTQPSLYRSTSLPFHLERCVLKNRHCHTRGDPVPYAELKVQGVIMGLPVRDLKIAAALKMDQRCMRKLSSM